MQGSLIESKAQLLILSRSQPCTCVHTQPTILDNFTFQPCVTGICWQFFKFFLCHFDPTHLGFKGSFKGKRRQTFPSSFWTLLSSLVRDCCSPWSAVRGRQTGRQTSSWPHPSYPQICRLQSPQEGLNWSRAIQGRPN